MDATRPHGPRTRSRLAGLHHIKSTSDDPPRVPSLRSAGLHHIKSTSDDPPRVPSLRSRSRSRSLSRPVALSTRSPRGRMDGAGARARASATVARRRHIATRDVGSRLGSRESRVLSRSFVREVSRRARSTSTSFVRAFSRSVDVDVGGSNFIHSFIRGGWRRRRCARCARRRRGRR